MGKMSELDMYQSDIEALNESPMSHDMLVSKHQQVSETPTPQDVVKSKNGFDYVIGSRFLNFDSSDNRFSDKAVLPVNEFGNKSITFIINLIFKKNITDSQSEFKCFVAKKLKELKLESNRFEIETELLIKSFRKEFKIKEVPVHRYERKYECLV